MELVRRGNRGVVLYGVHDLRVEDLPIPELRRDQVLVEMKVVGICGSDVHFYDWGSIGPFIPRRPLVLGHEPVGTVVDRGEGATKHEIGTRVAVEAGVPCARCGQCRSGRYNLCPNVEFLGTPPRDGALARYLAMHEDFVHPVPDALSDESAALVEPLSVALYASTKAGVGPGRRVLVTGAGPVGLLCLQVARASGATAVAVSDVRDSALERAARLGASQTINVGKQSLGDLWTEPDILLECSGNERAMEQGVAALAPGGVGVLVGIGPEAARMPVATIRRRELTVTATFRYRHVFPAAIDLAASGRIDLAGLVTDRYTLEQAPEAFVAASDAISGEDTGRVKALIYVGSD